MWFLIYSKKLVLSGDTKELPNLKIWELQDSPSNTALDLDVPIKKIALDKQQHHCFPHLKRRGAFFKQGKRFVSVLPEWSGVADK